MLRMRSMPIKAWCTSSSSKVAADVGCSRLLTRSNSGMPMRASNSAISRVTTGWVTSSDWAAAVTERRSISARNASRWRSVIFLSML